MAGLVFGVYKVSQLVSLIVKRLWGVTSFTILLSLLVYWFFGGVYVIICVLLGLAELLYNAQDLLLYHPMVPFDSRVLVPRPIGVCLPYDDIYHPCKDGTLIHMFLIKHDNDCHEKPTFVYLHGNAGNMGHRLENVVDLYRKVQVNVLMVEYRGYGLSQGIPSENGFYLDAMCAVDYLHTRFEINPEKIVLFGRSLGGAVAIDVASRQEYSKKICCLITENTFTTIPDMLKVLLGCQYTRFIPQCVYKNKFLSTKKMQRVVVPTLIICGGSDTLVPPEMARALYNYCGASYKLTANFPEGGHNDTWTVAGYYSAIIRFLIDSPPGPQLFRNLSQLRV